MGKSNDKNRLEVIDSLRGFAIMAIMLLHSIEHFNFYVFPKADTQPEWLTKLDGHVWDSLFFLFGGKGYAIFALLFGFTFSLMYRKQLLKGVDFGGRFFWRLILLAVFALINGAFFPGEVLSLYAMVGSILIIVRRWNHNFILLCAILLLSQPIEWWRFIHTLIDSEYVLPAKQSGQYWGLLKEGQLGESFLHLVKTNTLYGHLVTYYWSLEVGRTVQTAGLFVLGYWIGLKDLFVVNVKSIRFWKSLLAVSILVFIPLYLLESNTKEIDILNENRRTLGRIVDMYGNLTFTFVLVASFWLLYRTDWFRKIASGLRYPGRMSLSAYVLQSVVGSFIFFGYGFGLGPHIRHTISFGIGIVVWILMFYLFKWWINKYGQGPLEKLWHKLTWINTKR